MDDEESVMNPKCTLCGEAVKSSGNTSNLMKHLKSNQVVQARLIEEEQEETKCQKAEQTPAKQIKQVTTRYTQAHYASRSFMGARMTKGYSSLQKIHGGKPHDLDSQLQPRARPPMQTIFASQPVARITQEQL